MTTGMDLAKTREEEVPNIISTGNQDIDEKMGGGIPKGSLMLIEGQSASGKSVLAQQLTWGSLHDDHRVILYTTERSVSSQMRQMASLGLDALDFLLSRRLKIYPIQRLSGLEAADLLGTLSVRPIILLDFSFRNVAPSRSRGRFPSVRSNGRRICLIRST